MIAVVIDFVLYALSGLFAVITAHTSNLPAHRAWGEIAVWGYAGAAIAVWFLRRRRLALVIATWLTTSWVPLGALAMRGLSQEEVYVVEESARRFLEHGTPYLDRDSIAALPEPLLGYTPYQPAMAIFGLPRALLGNYWWTDARVFFALATAAALIAAATLLWPRPAPAPATPSRRNFTGVVALTPPITATPVPPDGESAGASPRRSMELQPRAGLARLRRPSTDLPPGSGLVRALVGPDLPGTAPLIRALQMATVLPLCALTLATGGDDIPVLALCLLSFALAARDRFALAGVAIGVAAAMKLFAWPIAVVLAGYVLHRRGTKAYFLAALGIPILALLPAVLVDAQAFVENVISFPTGHGLVTSPAASPLLGHFLAGHVPHGRTIALALLGAVGLAIGGYLIAKPPRDVRAVAIICAIGLLAAIVLMPSTRFGYLLYPVAFFFWAPCLARDRVAG